MEVHQTAIVHPEAKLGDNSQIGPYCIIGPHVSLGANCVLHSHVTIEGHTSIGEGNEFFSHCAIGGAPQDLSYKGEPTKVQIGHRNKIREFVSINRGSLKQNEITKVGDENILMAYSHLGHDVELGNNSIIVNTCSIAGHVKVGNGVIVSGGTMVSQFITIGDGAYIGGASAVDRDIPNFCAAVGNRAHLKGINIIGLRRRGFAKTEISQAVDFYRDMEASALSPRAFVDHPEKIVDYEGNSVVKNIIDFIRESEIGIAPFTA